MSNPRYKLLRLLIPLIVFLLGCPAPQPPPPEQVSATGITLLGQSSWIAPGSRNTFLVQVRTPYGGPIEKDQKVAITLTDRQGNQQKIYEGTTDDNGIARVKFNAPTADQISDPNQTMQVVAQTQYGQQTLQRDVYLGKVFNVLISSDKPIYQPGQTIHLRALALDSNSLKAAQAMTMTLTVADPQGNKLMRKQLSTSDYGIVAADFVLDTQAASGDYIITTELGPTSSSRSVEVKPYLLPRFKVEFNSEKPYYKPGDNVTGTVNANYFFGKPVANSTVVIKGFVTDFERSEIFSSAATTDENGVATYEFVVPDYFASQLDNNTAKVDLEISVTDSANHVEKIDDEITIAAQPLLIDLVAESGDLRSKLDNIIYVHTHYPDGADAPTQLLIQPENGDPLTVTTDLYGLATFTLTPKSFSTEVVQIDASDANGITVTHQARMNVFKDSNSLLLRSDKAEYKIGDTLNIDIAVRGQSSVVYLDVIKGRQTFALVPLPIKNGKASAAINIDGSLLGTLELNAYFTTSTGEIISDHRYVLVNPAPAQIDIQANAEEYRPGDTATLDIRLQRDGQPLQGAVGISIVDESVFALGAQEPGFARTYFLLNRQLLEPRYEIYDFPGFGDGATSPYDNTPPSIQTALSDPQKVVIEQAQQIALAGFFAQESITNCELRIANCAVDEMDSSPATRHLPPATQLALGWLNRGLLALPLLGLAFYDGSRKRRLVVIGMLLLSITGGIVSACAAGVPGAPAAAPAAAADSAAEMPAAESAASIGGSNAAPEPPRLRQFFPETLFWLPEQETDANGHLTLDVPIADSITTWRVSVIASDKDGNLGSAQAPLKVFQDFFVEPDFPRFLTVGDEVSVPVSIFNYLSEKQTVKLEIEKADWFEFVEDAELSFEIGPNEVAAAYLPIYVTGFGKHDFTLTASGSRMSDAVLKAVEVLPNGKLLVDTQSGKLQSKQQFTVAAPTDAVADTSRLVVKLYPGVVSQLVDGLEGMLREPNGCFEQTSSATYPNILVLDYLKTTNQSSPRIQMTAERYINLGYQRLLSFEVDNYPGGFSLFGDPPPQLMLTAYGLMEFGDMAKVSYVDPNLIERAANFIMNQQQSDGSWSPAGMTIESGLENMGSNNLLPTAYILWALADAGYAQSAPAQQATAFIKAQTATLLANEQQSSALDPYALALLANALIAVDAQDQVAATLLDQLVNSAEENGEGYFAWNSGVTSYMGSYGPASSIETAAMMVIAALRSGHQLDAAQKAVDSLLAQRAGNGTYYSTQTTVLVLKAMLLAAKNGGEGKSATVTITLNNGQQQTVQIDDSNGDVVQMINFDDLNPASNELQISVDGDRAVQYQIITSYYVPWTAVANSSEQPAVDLAVQYDRSEMKVNDSVGVTATIELNTAQAAGTLMVTLGVPPGFLPVLEDFDVMVAQDQIDRYDFTLRQVNVYLTNVAPRQPITLNYHLLARYPVKVQTPASTAYDYYSPNQNGDDAPQRIVVNLGTADE